jgi:hypothetical protein
LWPPLSDDVDAARRNPFAARDHQRRRRSTRSM